MDWRLKLAPGWKQPDVKAKLLTAKSEQDVKDAFQLMGSYNTEHCASGNLPRTILEALKDRDFPKIEEDAQIAFIADSMAARGDVSARRSRQIVRRERKRQNRDRDE